MTTAVMPMPTPIPVFAPILTPEPCDGVCQFVLFGGLVWAGRPELLAALGVFDGADVVVAAVHFLSYRFANDET